MPAPRAALAEFIGTFALTFFGAGAIIACGGDNLVAIALAHGIILAVMVSAALHISGGQLNPAVSIALAAIGQQPVQQAITFIIAQLAGAICAALLLNWTFASLDPDAVNLGATLGSLSLTEVNGAANPNLNILATIALEIIATFMLMWVIMGVAVDGRSKSAHIAGFAIGLTIAALILAIGPLTGASMNPARSLGPALIGGNWDMHWAYWVAPIIGALLAAFTYRACYGAAPGDAAYDAMESDAK